MYRAFRTRPTLLLLTVVVFTTSLACSKNGRNSSRPVQVATTGQGVDSEAPSGTITVVARGFRTDDGQARIALFAAEEGFPGDIEYAVATDFTTISGGEATVTFEALPLGEYAIAILHDENDDDEMDTNFLGIPSEGIGVSNDATSTFGPPDYEDAAFMLDSSNLELTISIRYL